MRPLFSMLLIAVAVSALIACIHTAYARAMPIGESAPPRPPGCALVYEHVAPADALVRWRQVGDICVSASALDHPTVEDVYRPGDLHDALSERACALGGEIVTPIGLCTNGHADSVEFGVYVRKP